LLALIEKGAQRKESYEAVQRNAMASWRGGGGLQELAEKDPFIVQHLNGREIATCFNPQYYLRHLDQIYRRVFGRARSSSGGKKKGARS
ncbi:MAG: adenylosuccinate lyase, partial [Nitrospira sp.]|nr:adenylosuccinate lyase [Nitrospira sp.]